jgi:hypothetical protein
MNQSALGTTSQDKFAVASWFPGDIYASRRRYAAQRWCSENRAMAFGNRVRAQTYA